MFPAFVRDGGWTEKNYGNGRKAKAIAIFPRGMIRSYINQSSTDEAVRRVLQECGIRAFLALILAVDDVFVVPIPTSMRVIGLFRAAAAAIANNSRDEVAVQLAGAAPGWHAVAVGTRGIRASSSRRIRNATPSRVRLRNAPSRTRTVTSLRLDHLPSPHFSSWSRKDERRVDDEDFGCCPSFGKDL